MDWLLLLIAGGLEVSFVACLQKGNATGSWWYQGLSMASVAGSLLILGIVTKTIPLSVAYAVWTGIGAVGSVVYGMMVLHEDRRPLKLVFIGCIILGVIGLRIYGQ